MGKGLLALQFSRQTSQEFNWLCESTSASLLSRLRWMTSLGEANLELKRSQLEEVTGTWKVS